MRFISTFIILIVLNLALNTAKAKNTCTGLNTPESTRIYFINGFTTQPSGMNRSRNELKRIVGDLGDNAYDISINSNSDNTMKVGANDIYELVKQALGSREVADFWKWYNDPLSSSNPSAFTQAYAKTYIAAAAVEYATNTDLRVMVDQYLSNLRAGKKVVLVSHSQGNFFANSAHRYIVSQYPELRSSIGVVAVGTPAGYVGGGGSFIQNAADVIINRLVKQTLGLTVVASNVYIAGFESSNHAFIETYIAGGSTDIASAVRATKNGLVQPEVDADCDKRIPEIKTLNAINVTDNSATIKGRLTRGINVDAWLVSGEDPSNLFCDATSHNGLGIFNDGDFVSLSVSNLMPNSTYYSLACAKGPLGGVKSGGIVTFITQRSNEPAVVSTNTPWGVFYNYAVLRGSLQEGRNAIIWVNTAPVGSTLVGCNLNQYQYFRNAGSTTNNAFYNSRISVNNLLEQTQYFYRFCAHNGLGDISDGGVKSFTTLKDWKAI